MTDLNLSLLQAADFAPVSLQAPDAWCGHLPFAAWLMRTLRPAVFVELGTHSGNSYFSFCQSARDADLATKCYAVDTWQGDEHAGNYGDEIFQQVHTHNQSYYAGFSRLLRTTFDDAATSFSDASIDLLHIDGLHTYEAVKHDFETWLPKLAPGAIVLFHDTNVRERGFGVWQLWDALRARYRCHLEFVHSHGLGVLQIDGAAPGQTPAWLEPAGGQQQGIKNYFSALGARQLLRYEVRQTHGELAAARAHIVQRDEQIAQLHQSLADVSVKLHTANLALCERDPLIAQLHQVVAQTSERLDTANAALAERDLLIVQSQQDVAVAGLALHNANAALTERDALLAQSQQSVADLGAQLQAALSSLAERDDKTAKVWQAFQG